ncbi:MAG: pyridoxal phosphate-dependent aminotransferase, partial [Aestuariivirgaceae bacterium]|nr:pyridoxal phosphate-dependent aminotransferase [Aestuariivirgaceae bacterium]
VVSLTLGEPDFDTPAFIQQAATDAMRAGFTHYAPVQGIPELRAALSEKLARENGLHYSADEIAITNGAKQAITNAVYALIDEGDEVILLSPFWVAYEGIVRMAGGIPVQIHAGADEGFKVPASRIAAAITPKTKLIMLNSPNNPTGAVFSKAELEAIAAVVASHPRLMLMSDEIYEYILFEGELTSFGALPGMRERTITINGFSKGYAMTGWRLGYAAAPLPVAKAMAKVQSTFTAGANAFVQRAALAALKDGEADATRMRESYRIRRDLIITALKQIPGLKIKNPPGTFYAFPDVSAFLGKRAGNHTLNTVDELCDWLLDVHGLASVPGSAFGDANCLRLSFASSEEEITKGTERLAKALGELA